MDFSEKHRLKTKSVTQEAKRSTFQLKKLTKVCLSII